MMSPKTIISLVGAGVGTLVILIVVMMNISAVNQEVDLRNQAAAQEKANQVIYDEVWKVLQQKAGILDKFADDFKSIYGTIMDARYQGEKNGPGPTFKWIQEHNPSFTPEMYKDLSVAIEAYRGKFSRVQQKLVDIKREHDNLRQKIPSCWFVGEKPELKITVVTSTKTERTFETGREDDIELFPKK
jgi:hypothetical protein